MTKKGLCLLLLLALAFAPVRAWGATGETKSQVYLLNHFDVEGDGNPLFLFCQGIVRGGKASPFFLFSTASIEGNVDGDVYAFFSRVEVDGKITGRLHTLSSSVRLTPLAEVAGGVTPLFDLLSLFQKTSRYANQVQVYDDTVPIIVWQLVFALAKIWICFILYSLKRGFFIQGAMAFAQQPRQVVRRGLLGYFIFICTMLLFLFSVVGFPISLILLVVLFIIYLMGETALGLYLGRLYSAWRQRETPAYMDLLTGVVALEAAGMLPYWGYFTGMVCIATLAIGITLSTVLNGLVYHRYFDWPEAYADTRIGGGKHGRQADNIQSLVLHGQKKE